MVLVAAVAAVVVNLVFLRVAAKPLEALVRAVRQIARGRFGIQIAPFRTAELRYLAEAINAMSSSLAALDSERRQQMAKARRIQQHLLPAAMHAPGVEIVQFYQSASEVAGDYYDILRLADESWLVCVADVTGHGIPAALEAVMLKALLVQASEQSGDIARVLEFINRRFMALCLPEDFASMALFRWDPKTALVEYGSAGHEPAWFLSASGELRKLCSTGTLLGIQEEGSWDVERFQVNPRDRLLLLTDGVTEAFNPEGQLLGRERVAGLFRDARSVSAADALGRIDDALNLYRKGQTAVDDATAVLVEFLGGDDSGSQGPSRGAAALARY